MIEMSAEIPVAGFILDRLILSDFILNWIINFCEAPLNQTYWKSWQRIFICFMPTDGWTEKF